MSRERAFGNEIRTHRSLYKDAPASRFSFSGLDPLIHTPSLADFITTTAGIRFGPHNDRAKTPAHNADASEFCFGIFFRPFAANMCFFLQ